MTTKRILALLIAVLMLVSLFSACASNETKSLTAAAMARVTTPTRPTIPKPRLMTAVKKMTTLPLKKSPIS